MYPNMAIDFARRCASEWLHRRVFPGGHFCFVVDVVKGVFCFCFVVVVVVRGGGVVVIFVVVFSFCSIVNRYCCCCYRCCGCSGSSRTKCIGLCSGSSA